MKVIKRSGQEVEFDRSKIINAVSKANMACANEDERMTDLQIAVIAESVENKLSKSSHTPEIEYIQDLVIRGIMEQGAFTVAQLYTEYRFRRA